MICNAGKNDEADPRLLGGSKVSNEFDGGDAQPGYSYGKEGTVCVYY